MPGPPNLERRVLDALWRDGEQSVREVHASVGGSLAYTTIATVLDRLHTKARVVREKRDGSWHYRPAASRQEAVAAEVSQVLSRLDRAGEPVLLAFLDHVEQVDPEALDRLEALLRARREQK